MVGYTVAAIRADDPISFTALWQAGALAGGTALIGFFTPVEPFVGVNKTKVEVPMPPAVPEPGGGSGLSSNVRALSDLDAIDSERAQDVTYTYHSEVDLD
jgi:hypothetical protein